MKERKCTYQEPKTNESIKVRIWEHNNERVGSKNIVIETFKEKKRKAYQPPIANYVIKVLNQVYKNENKVIIHIGYNEVHPKKMKKWEYSLPSTLKKS